jgi:hypothetical protein
VHITRGEDGKKILLSKDYRQVFDIVNAYKNLKQAVSKASGASGPHGILTKTNGAQAKGYLKMTIAAQQHSKNQMNQELLVYALAASKLTSLSKPLI